MYKDKQKRAEYKKTHYKRVPLDVPIYDYEQLKAYCTKNNLKINTFIRSLITEKITRV